MGFAQEMLRSYECYFEVCLGLVVLLQLELGAGAVLVGLFWVWVGEVRSMDDWLAAAVLVWHIIV